MNVRYFKIFNVELLSDVCMITNQNFKPCILMINYSGHVIIIIKCLSLAYQMFYCSNVFYIYHYPAKRLLWTTHAVIFLQFWEYLGLVQLGSGVMPKMGTLRPGMGKNVFILDWEGSVFRPK